MYDYSYVLALLRASAAEHRRHALSGNQAEIVNRTTERTLRNRALAITHRLEGMPRAETASIRRRGRAAACRRPAPVRLRAGAGVRR
jgi:hypothetical protein